MKYLILSITHATRNIDHALNLLRGAIREAVYLDRTLIVGTFSIAAAGNLGHTLKNIRYDHFIDLNKSQVLAIENGCRVRPVEPLNYLFAEEFELPASSSRSALSIEGSRPISPQQNRHYPVIIRATDADEYAALYSDILVRFDASSEVEDLSDCALRAMGIRLEHAKKLCSLYQGVDFAANSDFFQLPLPKHPSIYACLHVRKPQHSTAEQIYAANPSQIEANFDLMTWKREITSYVMSDIHNPNYFDFLKKRYRIYQYFDIPELKALISAADGQTINQAMLYSVEKNIMKYATYKLIPFVELSGMPIVYSNSSYTTPWRYRLQAWWRSLTGAPQNI